MRPGVLLVGLMFSSGVIVAQKLATLKMAIRTEGDSQKAVAIDAHIDESQLARKLADKEPLTLRDIDRFPENVQAAWHLEELARLGLPERVKRYLPILRAFGGAEKKSA
jgi:hypothetical protein